MYAILYNILERHRDSDVEFSSIKQFTLDEGQSVSAQIIIDERIWHPYCLERDKRRVIFLELSPEIDLSNEAFIYQRQFSDAQRLLAVPYDLLPEISKQVELSQKLLFIFSIGRCGSTLLNQILNQVEGTYCLSEPDVISDVSLSRNKQEYSDADYKLIIESCTRLQAYALRQDNVAIIGIKYRSLASDLMDLFYECFPDAHYIFMYRNAINWVASFYSFYRRLDTPKVFSGAELIEYYGSENDTLITLDMISRYIDLAREEIFLEEFIVCLLLHTLDKYLQAFENKIPLYALHYEDFVVQKEQGITELLNYLGIANSQLENALKGFQEDSQRGTSLAQDTAVEKLSAEQAERAANVLKLHPKFNAPNFYLPSINHSDLGILTNNK
jgi:hypothetical protein